MPPEDRFVPRFAAEPPQDLLPYGRWAQRLQEEFLEACLRIDADGEEPTEFFSVADFTPETAEANPDWTIDLCDEVVGTWRGEQGKAAEMTLIWGRPMVEGAAVATAELADLAVDQCVLVEGRFTLLAPDAYRGDTLDVRLFDRRSGEVARESLYTDDDDEDDLDVD